MSGVGSVIHATFGDCASCFYSDTKPAVISVFDLASHDRNLPQWMPKALKVTSSPWENLFLSTSLSLRPSEYSVTGKRKK